MNFNWIILAIGLAGGALPSWWVTSTYYQGIISAEHEEAQKQVIEQHEHNRLDLLAYAKRITDSGAQHDKDQITINRLAADARRVRVTLPNRCPVSTTTQAATDQDRDTGLAVERANEYLAQARQSIQELGQRCAELNVDAIRANRQAP